MLLFLDSVCSFNAVTEDVYNPTVTFGVFLLEILYDDFHS